MSEEEIIDIQNLEELNETIQGNSKLIDMRTKRLNELLRWAKQIDRQIKEVKDE